MGELTVIGGELERPLRDLENPAMAYIATLQSERSRYEMRRMLDQVAGLFALTWDTLPWQELAPEHVLAIRAKLAETLAPSTVNRALSAIRGVARQAWRKGMVDAERLARIRDIENLRGERLPAGRALSSGEIAALMGSCDQTPAGSRDAAMIALGYGAGLRRSELVALDLADLSVEDDMLALQVLGKRNKERLVYLDNGARDAVLDWLAVRGDDPGALFWSGRKGGRLNKRQRMSGSGFANMLTKRANDAKIADFTPHDLRRSFISDQLDAGTDIATVADMAGHASVQTTRQYDRRGERAKRRAAKALHVPYRRRFCE